MSKTKIVLILLLALVIGAVGCTSSDSTPSGTVGSAGRIAMEADIKIVQDGVGFYLGMSGEYPTEDGKLPSSDEYALIDFEASFTQGSTMKSFYPDIISELPKHHDEKVWRIDSKGKVSVNMRSSNY